MKTSKILLIVVTLVVLPFFPKFYVKGVGKKFYENFTPNSPQDKKLDENFTPGRDIRQKNFHNSGLAHNKLVLVEVFLRS